MRDFCFINPLIQNWLNHSVLEINQQNMGQPSDSVQLEILTAMVGFCLCPQCHFGVNLYTKYFSCELECMQFKVKKYFTVPWVSGKVKNNEIKNK